MSADFNHRHFTLWLWLSSQSSRSVYVRSSQLTTHHFSQATELSIIWKASELVSVVGLGTMYILKFPTMEMNCAWFPDCAVRVPVNIIVSNYGWLKSICLPRLISTSGPQKCFVRHVCVIMLLQMKLKRNISIGVTRLIGLLVSWVVLSVRQAIPRSWVWSLALVVMFLVAKMSSTSFSSKEVACYVQRMG